MAQRLKMESWRHKCRHIIVATNPAYQAATFNSFFWYSLPFKPYQTIFFDKTANIIYKKLQAIYLMLHKRWYKTAKIKKYKHEHYALAYSSSSSSRTRSVQPYIASRRCDCPPETSIFRQLHSFRCSHAGVLADLVNPGGVGSSARPFPVCTWSVAIFSLKQVFSIWFAGVELGSLATYVQIDRAFSWWWWRPVPTRFDWALQHT